MREGLRLVEEREAKPHALRDTVNGSIVEGGRYGEEAVQGFLDEQEAGLSKAGT